MKIILYGLGRCAEIIRKLLEKSGKHEIVGYTDSFSSISVFYSTHFYKLQELKNAEFDYIVITMQDRRTAWLIMQNLIAEYGIEKEKIVPFSIWQNSEIVENIEFTDDLEGIILGNSHAYYGFLPPFLSCKFVNLSCPSQTIYYNNMVYNRFALKNPAIAENLKYVIFDLYDYNYLNSDISLTSGLFDYFAWGGIIDKHHYDSNTHYTNDFDTQLFMEKCMLAKREKRIQDIMKELFDNYVGLDFIDSQKDIYNRYNFIRINESLPVEKFEEAIVEHKYYHTINENKEILNALVDKVHLYNPKCKIVFTLIPRYRSMEKILSLFMTDWKEEFADTIKELQEKENVYFLNYKERTDINENYRFYYDINHLNTLGGKCLSSILNEDIKRLV